MRAQCYCYALDRPSDSGAGGAAGGFCVPGLGSGLGEPRLPLTCADLSARILADGAVAIDAAEALAGPPRGGGGHHIVLRLRPAAWCRSAMAMRGCAPDFHLLRQDATGRWSHKIGEQPVTDADANGARITDPSPEAAPLEGGFTELCGWFRRAACA